MANTSNLTITGAWARANGRLEFDVDVSHLPHILVAALTGSPKFTANDVQANGATVSSTMSAMSWGGKITVQFVALSATTSAVEARIEPFMPTNIIDFGQAKKDMRAFLDLLVATAARPVS